MNTITKIDRGTGRIERVPFWPTLTELAKWNESPAYVIQNILLDGQEFATAGFVYRFTADQMADVRAAMREVAYDRLAMAE